MDAQKAIRKIKSVKTTFMGCVVGKFNNMREIRNELQKMAETGELSPAEYWKSLKLTFPKMSETIKSAELKTIA